VFGARVPVPWDKDRKAQLFPGRNGGGFARAEDEHVSRPAAPVISRKSANSPIVIKQRAFSRKPLGFAVELVEDLRPKIRDIPVTAKAASAVPVLPSAPGLSQLRWRELAPALVKWAVARGLIKAEPSARARTQISAVPTKRQIATRRGKSSLVAPVSAPIAALVDYLEPQPALDPFKTTTRVRQVQIPIQVGTEKLMPPSLLEWAVAKGIKRQRIEFEKPLDPFATKTRVIALERQRAVYAALKRGEWCFISDVESFPPRLRRWLLERNCVLIRWVGGASLLGQANAPLNGYVTESGIVFYVAENGTTFYVQES
jgi:hypothetical protein